MLAGCATSRLAQLPTDNCQKGNTNKTNTIEVFMDGTTRRPVAVPDVCHVKAGTEIVWVQRKDRSKQLVVMFDKGCGSPDAWGKGTFTGEFDHANSEHVATLRRTRAFDPGHDRCQGRYDYSVSIGGIKSDPSIIIDM
jgi:plastocyanin